MIWWRVKSELIIFSISTEAPWDNYWYLYFIAFFLSLIPAPCIAMPLAFFAHNSNSMEISLVVIPLLVIRSQQNFAHAPTAQLSCHEQNFIAITVLKLSWTWTKFPSNLNCEVKTVSEPRPRSLLHMWKYFNNLCHDSVKELYEILNAYSKNIFRIYLASKGLIWN